MEFFIKKNATLPVVKVKVIKDGSSDFESIYQNLNNSDISFSMYDTFTKIPKIVAAPCNKEMIINTNDNTQDYYISFKFTSFDTKETGRFQGSFMIQNEQGDLILPLTENLYINIQENVIETDFCC